MNDPEDKTRPGGAAWLAPLEIWKAALDGFSASTLFMSGLSDRISDFFVPYLRASAYFGETEAKKLFEEAPDVTLRRYMDLWRLNVSLAQAAWRVSMNKASDVQAREFARFADSLANTVAGTPGPTVDEYMSNLARTLHMVAIDFPKAIRDVRSEYGLHFEEPGYVLASETDRMWLYQVLPNEPGVETDPGRKPALLAHPYVLGPNILAFLPGENKSLAHAFANQGIPTYVRIVKDILKSPATQIMTGEDDARDTAEFCRLLKERHGKPVTINGVCQGGFITMADILSGQLDGLVDAFIGCAAPMDGTLSKGLTGYLKSMPERFHSLDYSLKTLTNGNRVVDGSVMSWVYKLKSIDAEAPLFTFYRDFDGFSRRAQDDPPRISKTAAAINYWLIYDRTDLPVEVTKLSRLSYFQPVSEDGELPIRLFGKALNFHYLAEKGIRCLICYGAQDDLVEPPSALVPTKHVDVEVTEFPKGHAAIMTSWSNPQSEYGLHKVYPNGQRGPVRFHMDLDEEISRSAG